MDIPAIRKYHIGICYKYQHWIVIPILDILYMPTLDCNSHNGYSGYKYQHWVVIPILGYAMNTNIGLQYTQWISWEV